MAVPDFVIAGNVARDVVPGGWRPGGSALYAAQVARGLGRRVGVITAAPAEVAAALPPDIEVVRHPAATATSFENVYTPAGRVQFLRAAGEPIPAALVPAAWEEARIALIGPIYHEVDVTLAARFGGIVGVCGQGCLRAAGPDGRVSPLPPERWDVAPWFRHMAMLFLSEEDIAPSSRAAVERWAAHIPVLVVTDGRRGAEVWARGDRFHTPAVPAREVDPTGAGDAFATGFLIASDEGAAPREAARFAAAVAALVIETEGAARPSRAAVEARLRSRGAP